MRAKCDQEVPERAASWNRLGLGLFFHVKIGEFLQNPN